MPLSRKLAKLIIEEKATLDQVVDLLHKYKMLSLLPSVKKALEQMSSQVKEGSVMRIESPFPLSEESIQKIKRIVGNDIAEHEVSLNKDLLAGFKVRFKGVLHDGSAERIIKQLLTSN